MKVKIFELHPRNYDLATNGQNKTKKMEATNPLTCKLTTPDLQQRKATVIKDFKSFVLERKEHEDGFSYKFDGTDEMLDKLTELIKSERHCCDFFTFQITVAEETVYLRITGPAGTKEFIKGEIDL